jgi:pimeloyl-ACP methyl ester carboxylesterase
MRAKILIAAMAMIAAACGSDQTPARAPDVEPTIIPGTAASGQISIEGTTLDYVVVTPEGFRTGDTAPILLTFPPGGQDIGLTRSIVAGTFESEALTRGWVVISPAAPGGQLFFNGSETLVPPLLDWIESWVTPTGGKFHLAGISNGGISAFRVAGQNPQRFASVVVFPGFPRTDADVANLAELADTPIRMFVGGNDPGWITPMQDSATALAELGGDVVLEIAPDEGHILGSLSDGVRIFDELEAIG